MLIVLCSRDSSIRPIEPSFSRSHARPEQIFADAARPGVFNARGMGAAPGHLAVVAAQPGNLARSTRARQGGLGPNNSGVVTAREGLSFGQ
jgi:hypothetical protein